MPSTCSIDGCGQQAQRRGWCAMHYARWQRHGDPLGGRSTFNGEPKAFLAAALTSATDDCILWPFNTGDTGYGQIYHARRQLHVHQVACEHRNGPKPSPELEAAHSCGARACCNPRHLRWATPFENGQDKVAHGTALRGERSPRSKLTEKDVVRLLGLVGTTSREVLAAEFGISSRHVGAIVAGESWAHVPRGGSANA